MNEKTQLGVRILVVALVLGVLGDALLREGPWGFNFFLWSAALVLALIELGSWRREALAGGGHWLLLPVAFSGAAFMWHDSPALKLLNVLAVLVALSLVLLRAQGARLFHSGIMAYVLGGVLAGLNAIIGLLILLLGDIQWRGMLNDRLSRRAVAVIRGLLFALPVLLVFGSLLIAADAIFEGIIKDVLHLDFTTLFMHAFVTGFFAWIVAGFLRGVLVGKDRESLTSLRAPSLSLGIIETGIVLGSLDLLFLSFVLVQFRYFFGGAAHVGVTKGLTYAEYARRGFFELLTVAALVLPLLLLAHWLLRKGEPGNERIFRVLAGVQILLLFVIMASAFQRMRLYQQEYGLTEQRLYPTAFMGWLAVVFIWFAVTVLRGHRERFAFGAMVAGFLLIGALHLLNPDAFVARVNVARALEGRRFDAHYAASLSADAVPTLVVALPGLRQEDRCTLAAQIINRWSSADASDWRTWNHTRTRALQVVQHDATQLRAMACPGKDKKD